MRTLLFAVALGCSNQAADQLDQSKRDLTRVQVQRVAKDWYPRWSITSPDQLCPSSVDELAKAAGATAADAIDPWGHPIQIVCGPSAPAVVVGVGALSLGPDGKHGTPDDITSWEPSGR